MKPCKLLVAGYQTTGVLYMEIDASGADVELVETEEAGLKTRTLRLYLDAASVERFFRMAAR